MKYFIKSACIAGTIAFTSVVQADLNGDAEQIFTEAQAAYSQFFPSNQPTEMLSEWLYRYYPSSKIYLGVNTTESAVYLLGGAFGDVPFLVGEIDIVLALLKEELSQSVLEAKAKLPACDVNQAPEGIFYEQNGNNVSVSTQGQCIEIPQNSNLCNAVPETNDSGKAIETGLHVLTQNKLRDMNFSGLNFNIPGMPNPLDAMGENMANTRFCIVNAPSQLAEYQVNTDVCFDVTNQFSAMTASGMVAVSPPVTIQFKSDAVSTIVSDCFATDALSVTDLVTKQVWVKGSGGFVEVK